MESVIQETKGLVANQRFSAAECLDISLPERRMHCLKGDRRGVGLICLEGVLWITQSGDPIDYLLSAGQSLTVTCLGTVLIQGLPDGRLRLVPVIHGFEQTL